MTDKNNPLAHLLPSEDDEEKTKTPLKETGDIKESDSNDSDSQEEVQPKPKEKTQPEQQAAFQPVKNEYGRPVSQKLTS